MSVQIIARRQAIPILYTKGTHYDVGFDMGHTFGSLINDFLQLSAPLNYDYLPLYNTAEGKKVYDATLASVKESFPQYIRELEGVADGARVEFHKLFLLHMDEILPKSLARSNTINGKQPIGCSSIILNTENDRVLGHTEDALTETLNHYYIVVAHIISDSPQGKHQVQEERFTSLCYAGHLPGYTMGYNHHGFVFSINTLSAAHLRGGHTPRHFIARALLAAENYDQALTVLKDKGVGAGDGCSINMAFLNSDDKTCYNIEMGPVVEDEYESRLDVKEIPLGASNFHANKYEHMDIEQQGEHMLASSVSRMNTFQSYKEPTSKKDIATILSDCTGGEHCVFRDNGRSDEMVKTIAVGLFDLNAKTYELYSDMPKTNKPLVTLPLILKEK